MSSRVEEFRHRVWDLLEVTEDEATGEVHWDWVDIALFILIVLSVLSVVFETVPTLWMRYARAFWVFDVFTVVVFTVEYIWRLWACTADSRYASPFRGRLRYARSAFGIVDLLSILPFYMALALPVGLVDLRFLRVLRLMRFARVLKLSRYSESVDRLKAVFRERAADLFVALSSVLVILVLASSIMYHVENEAQPEAFTSIPAAMWWGVSALTTVGYGDIMPITPLGKIVGGGIQLLGIALFALPAAILAAGYEDEARRRRERKGFCHACGRPIGDQPNDTHGMMSPGFGEGHQPDDQKLS